MEHASFPARLATLPRSGGSITFVISSSAPAPDAIISLYAVNGAFIGTIEAGFKNAGTNSFPWTGAGKGRNHLSAGTYLCKLIVRGSTVAAKTVPVK